MKLCPLIVPDLSRRKPLIRLRWDKWDKWDSRIRAYMCVQARACRAVDVSHLSHLSQLNEFIGLVRDKDGTRAGQDNLGRGHAHGA